jgi:large subunit ribosomal protein L23
MSNEKQMELRLYDVIKRPLVTEKSQMVMQNANQYTFEVLPSATKADIKVAVQTMFNVTVESVNTMNRLGKTRVFRGRKGQRQDTKKAIVRLKAGESIAIGLGA